MPSFNILALGVLAAAAASAQVVPTAPGPGEVFKVGSKCNIEWNLDTSGTWTSFEIQLMTGSNLAMVPVQTVASGLDGTTGSGTIDFTCPNVTPNSAIYFYQFSQAGQPTSWTTRFTIAGADGSTTPPTQSTNGIAWGTGSLVGQAGSAGSAGSSAAAGGAAGASVSRATGRSRSVAATGASGLASLAATPSTASAVTVTSVISQSSPSSSTSVPVSTVTMTSSPSSSASSSSSASAAGQSSSTTTTNNNAGSTLSSSVALVFAAAAVALAI
ncbi:cell wall beta-glucan synthesis family protein [Rhodotorula toruloides]|uniref:Cell wall beta-glucan synthesis family protein n=1 Tax=Rhodotorula toruloides TaxID=5286 RepID=A0A511KPA8_RHOTO|nr:cell wall beta-glucan synthesis family protein [Rhodotorula toruloides]